MKAKGKREYFKPQIADCVRIVPAIICGSEKTIQSNKPDDFEYDWEEDF